MFDDIYTVDKFHTQMKKAEMVTNIINKYNLNKETTALVGDTISDIDAACQSGIDVLLRRFYIDNIYSYFHIEFWGTNVYFISYY